jgi:hypothetical protein
MNVAMWEHGALTSGFLDMTKFTTLNSINISNLV